MPKSIRFLWVLGLLLLFPSGVFSADPPPDPSVPRFDIAHFRVEGNTLLPEAEIEKLLGPFTGSSRDFGTVQEALDALEAEYHRRGFTAVQAILPEQELEKGVVLFRVIEARIGAVRIEGNRFFARENLRRSLPDLKEGFSPRIDLISSSLRVANENPAKKVSLQMQGSDKEGEINALLSVVDEKPWKVSLQGDNTGNKATGEARTGVVLQHANVGDRDHVLTAMYTTSPEKTDKVNIFGGSYHVPFYGLAHSFDLFAGYSDVDSGTLPVGTADMKVSGRGSVFGARYNQTLTRIGRYEHKLVYGADYRTYRNNISLQGIPLDSAVRVNPLSLTYAGSWQLTGTEAGFNVGVSRNVPVGGGGQDEDFKQVRSNAPPYYTILRYGANVAMVLPGEWQGRLLYSGQYTDHPLIPGEQFGLGGATSLRGFQEREVADDRGNFGSIEIYTPNIMQQTDFSNISCRLLVFYDLGQVSRINPLPGEEARTNVASAGAGIRFEIAKHFNLAMDYGHVLNPGGSRVRGDGRLHVRAVLSY